MDTLDKLLEAVRFRQDWLRRYLASGGIMYDRILNRWITTPTPGPSGLNR